MSTAKERILELLAQRPLTTWELSKLLKNGSIDYTRAEVLKLKNEGKVVKIGGYIHLNQNYTPPVENSFKIDVLDEFKAESQLVSAILDQGWNPALANEIKGKLEKNPVLLAKVLKGVLIYCAYKDIPVERIPGRDYDEEAAMKGLEDYLK